MTPAERADDYLRQAAHRANAPAAALCEHARAAIAAGDLALAYAMTRELQRATYGLGAAYTACVDYARREIARAWTPELPSRSTARFQAWAAETGWRGV